MKLEVRTLANQPAGHVEVPDEVFAYPYKEHLVHEVVVALRAGQRSGTHKTKGRGEVSGSGRKLWRQKGTGRARMGSIRSPLWRTGGTVHGPKPRDYRKKVSVREKKNALKSALSRKVADEMLLVVDNLNLESHKTAALLSHLRALGIDGKALVVDRWENDNLGLASRNLATVKAVDAMSVNVYDVVDRPYLVISQDALGRLIGVLSQ
jgi:large subunit ribosomal protein L4